MAILLTLSQQELQRFKDCGLFSNLQIEEKPEGGRIKVTIGANPASAESTLKELRRRLVNGVDGYFYDTDNKSGNGTPELYLTAKTQKGVVGIFRTDGPPEKVTAAVQRLLGGDFEAFKNLLAGWRITAEIIPDHKTRYSQVLGKLNGGISIFDGDNNLETPNDTLWFPSGAVRDWVGKIDEDLKALSRPAVAVTGAAGAKGSSPAGVTDPAATGDAALDALLAGVGGEGATTPGDQAAPAIPEAPSIATASGPVKSVTLPGPLAALKASGLLKDLDVEAKEVNGNVEVTFKNPADSFKFSVRVKEAKTGYLLDPDKDPKNGNEVWQTERPDPKLKQNVTIAFGWGGDPAKPGEKPPYVLTLADFLKLVRTLPPPVLPVDYKGLDKVQPDALAKPDNYIFFPLLFNTETNEVERYMVLPAQNTAEGLNNMLKGVRGEGIEKVPLSKITNLKFFPPGYRLPTFEEVNRYIMDNLGVFAIASDMGMEERYRYEKDYLRLHRVSGLDVPVLVIPKAEEECSPVKHMEKSPTIISNYVPLKFPVPHDVAPQLFELLGASPAKDDMCAKGVGYGWGIIDRIEHFIDPAVPDWLNEPELDKPRPGTHFFTVRVNKGALVQARAAVDRAAKLVKEKKEPPSPKDRLLSDEELMTYRAWLVVSELDSSDIALLQDALGRLQDSIENLEKQGQRAEWGTPWWKLLLALSGATALGAAITKSGREAVMMTWEKMKKALGIVPDYLENWDKEAHKFDPYDSSVANREKIIRAIMAKLGSAETGVSRSVMMIGESSQGKTALMKEISRRIWVWQQFYEGKLGPDAKEADLPYLHEGLKESVFYAVKFDGIGADIGILGQWESRVRSFKRWLKIHPEAVIFGDEFQKGIGVGEATSPGKTEGKRDLFQHLKEEIADGKQAWVVSTTLAEYHLYIESYDPSHAFIRRFELITLESYTPEQVKEVMRQIANKLMPKDGVIVVDGAGTDALVDKLIDAGTPEFLVLNEAKNVLIDAANELRRKIREGDPSLSGTIDSEVRDVLISREKTALRIRNLRNRLARNSILHPVKKFKAWRALKNLQKEYARLETKLSELARDPAKRIVVTQEMLLETQKDKQVIAGKEAGKALETEVRKLKGEILQIQRDLKRYKVELPITKDVDAPRFPDEEQIMIVRRLRRLQEAAKKLLGMYEVKRESAGMFGLGGGGGQESSMADIQKQLMEVRRLAATNGYDPRLDDIVTDDPQKTELAVTRQQIRDMLEAIVKETMIPAAELGVADRDAINASLEQRPDEPVADYKLRLERVKKALEGHKGTLLNPAEDEGTKKARELAAREIGKIFSVYQGDTSHPMPPGADAQTRKIVRTMISMREDVQKLKDEHGVELVIPDTIDQPRKADGKPDEKPAAIATRLARVHAAVAELLRMHEGMPARGGMGGMGFPGMGEMEMPTREVTATAKAKQKEKVEKLIASGGYDPELDEVAPPEPEPPEAPEPDPVEELLAELAEKERTSSKRVIGPLVEKPVLTLGEALSAYFCHSEEAEFELRPILAYLQTLGSEAEVEDYLRKLAAAIMGGEAELDAYVEKIPGYDATAKKSDFYHGIIDQRAEAAAAKRRDILTHLETLTTPEDAESYLRTLAAEAVGGEEVLDRKLATVPDNNTPAKRSVSYFLILLNPTGELVPQQVERRATLVEALSRQAGGAPLNGLKETIPLRMAHLAVGPKADVPVDVFSPSGAKSKKMFGKLMQEMFEAVARVANNDGVLTVLKNYAAMRSSLAPEVLSTLVWRGREGMSPSQEACHYLEVIESGNPPPTDDFGRRTLDEKIAVEAAVLGRIAGELPLPEAAVPPAEEVAPGAEPATPSRRAGARVVSLADATALQRLRAEAASKLEIKTGDDGECREIEDLYKRIVGEGKTEATDADKERLYQAIKDGTPLPADWRQVVQHYLLEVLKQSSPVPYAQQARLAKIKAKLLELLGRGEPPPEGPGGSGGPGGARPGDLSTGSGRADEASAKGAPRPAAPEASAGSADPSPASVGQGAPVVDLGARRTRAARQRSELGGETLRTRAVVAHQLAGVSNEGVASGVLRGQDGRWYQVSYEVETPNFCSDAPAPVVILRDVAENRVYAKKLTSQGTVVVLYKAGRDLTGDFELPRFEAVVRGRVAALLNLSETEVSFARETEARPVASKPLPRTLKVLLEEVGLREDERARALRDGTLIEHLRIHLALAVQKDSARYEDLAFQLRVLDEFIKARSYQFPNRAEICLRFVEGYLSIQNSTGASLPASLYVELMVQRRFEEQRLREDLRDAVRGVERKARREREERREERERGRGRK